MTIQHRILLALALVFLCSLIVSTLVLRLVVVPAFAELDRDQAVKNANRIEQSIAGELTRLVQNVGDWSNWDETYQFALDASPEYVAANLQPSSLSNLDVEFMAFYDSAGQPIWVGGYDPATEEQLSFPALDDLARMAPVQAAAVGAPLRGLLEAGGRHYLIAASEILDSDGNGPSHGTMIMGDELDDDMLQELVERTEVVFHVRPHKPDPSVAGAISTGPREITVTDTLFIHRITMPDVLGGPVLDFDIETRRDAEGLGQGAVRIAIILLVVTAMATLAVIAVAINLIVVSPVREINRAMRTVGESADLQKRLAWTRGDELGDLARQFDAMLGQIADARRALLDLTFKLGRSDLATGMFHNVRNAMSPLANQLRRAVSGLTLPDTGHVARALAELKNAGTEPERKARLFDFLGVAWDQGERVRQVARAELEAATGQMAAIERILNQQHESQEAALAPESLSLAFLVDESLAFFGSGQLALANIEIDPALAAMPPVSAQRLPVIHVLYNVIANAIAAIEANGGTPGRVQIRAANDQGRGIVRLELIDNGIGVDVALLSEIFRPGYTTRPNKKGGEGLHWCANAMAANGGRIWAESEGTGRGMTIVMELPQADLPPGVTQGSEAKHDG